MMQASERLADSRIDTLEIAVECSQELPAEPSGALALLRRELDDDVDAVRSQAAELELFEQDNHRIIEARFLRAAEPLFDLDQVLEGDDEALENFLLEADEDEVEAEADERDEIVEPEVEPEVELELEGSDEIEAEADEQDDVAEQAAAVFDYPEPLPVPRWSGFNTLRYVFIRGLRGMVQSPLVQLLAIGTMAVCMLLLGTTLLIFQNARAVAQTL
ncbi:MAG: hypothetical protein KC457_26700, partial [Myxococcales bacterium]|nr:hypothetical protein [Myxococcales bacterium]